MKYGSMTWGQTEAVFNKLGGEKIVRGILDGTVKFTVTALAYKFLRPSGEVKLPEGTDFFDPHEYCQTRKNLRIWSGFKRKVLSVAQPTDGLAEMTVCLFDLVKSANDTEVRFELPEDHAFEVSELCTALAKMIDQQPNGEDGNLLSNDSWKNIFYFYVRIPEEIYMAEVDWSPLVQQWYWFAYELGDHRWRAGDRVFSRNCLPVET